MSDRPPPNNPPTATGW